MDPRFSNHSPIAISLEDVQGKGKRPFRFFNYLAQHNTFMQLVEEAWRKPVQGHLMQKIWAKLKKVKHVLTKLNRREFTGIENKLNAIRG